MSMHQVIAGHCE